VLAQATGGLLGKGFFWISPFIGGFSGLITGSNSASNAMFIKLQVMTANQYGLSANLLASIQNLSASHMTMASPSRVLLAATITGDKQMEKQLFRSIFAIVIGSFALMMLLAFLLKNFI